MQLDQQRIAVRERGFLEVMDLALRVTGAHVGRLVPAFLAGILPLALLNAWLLSGLAQYAAETEEFGWYVLYVVLMFALVSWQTPLATAPATLFLGQALFSERPGARGIARSFVSSLPQLVLYQLIYRALLMLPIVTWFVPGTYWPYLNEIILLERNPMGTGRTGRITTYRRMGLLHEGMGGRLFSRWAMSIAMGAVLLASFWASIWLLGAVLLNDSTRGSSGFTLYYPIALWTVVAFFTVVRFLSYLDLRIRREGWEVELLMRAEEARLTRQWT